MSASPTPPRLAEVSQAALAGQPVGVVRQRPRQLGLRVRVAWLRTSHQRPGTVIFVRPAGRLPAGTTVVVTGAISPPGHREDHGNGEGKGHGGGRGGPGG